MKTKYIKPEILITRIQTEQMIAQSPGLTGTYDGGPVLSRRRNSPAEEEEDYMFDDDDILK